jgi:hypothetical protein
VEKPAESGRDTASDEIPRIKEEFVHKKTALAGVPRGYSLRSMKKLIRKMAKTVPKTRVLLACGSGC